MNHGPGQKSEIALVRGEPPGTWRESSVRAGLLVTETCI